MTTDSATVCDCTVVPAGEGKAHQRRTNGPAVVACTVPHGDTRARCVPGPRVQPVSRVDPSTTARVPITLPLATVESVTCR
jgi:hypothetical protein